MITLRIRGATIRTPRGWVATAWVVGRKSETQRVDWLARRDRNAVRHRVQRVRDVVRHAALYGPDLATLGGAA